MDEQYQVIETSEGIKVLDSEGKRLHKKEAIALANQIIDAYEPINYLYLSSHMEYDCLWKIGVTNDVARRDREIWGIMSHWIPCPRRKIYTLEAEVHRRFKKRRVQGEWFDLQNSVKQGVDLVSTLKAFKTVNDVQRWLRDFSTYPMVVPTGEIAIGVKLPIVETYYEAFHGHKPIRQSRKLLWREE